MRGQKVPPPPGPDRVKHRNTIQERFLYGGGGGGGSCYDVSSLKEFQKSDRVN